MPSISDKYSYRTVGDLTKGTCDEDRKLPLRKSDLFRELSMHSLRSGLGPLCCLRTLDELYNKIGWWTKV